MGLNLSATLAAGFMAGLALLLGWLVMSPAIREGLVIKSGLIVMVLGLMGVAFLVPVLPCSPDGGMHPIVRSLLVVCAGALVVFAGLLWRIKTERPVRRWFRHSTGWPPLSPESRIDEEDVRHEC